jgi:hypothetical protein
MSRESPHRCESCPTMIPEGRARFCPPCRHRVASEAATRQQTGYRRLRNALPASWHRCALCGMRHQLNEMRLCWVCEYELAHPGHTVWGEFVLSERTADEASTPATRSSAAGWLSLWGSA